MSALSRAIADRVILNDVALAHPLKVRAIAEARIKTDKISADILVDLLRTDLLPRAYAPSRETRDIKYVLRQRMFYVRVKTMVKSRIYELLDRHPEILSEAPEVSDLFGTAGVKWLSQVVLPGDDNDLLASELELLKFLKEKVCQSDSTVRELGKRDMRASLLKSIPGIGPFFSVLILYEIDDVSRFSDERKLCAYAGLVPSTYASGGKVFHGRITKTGSKWLRWAAIEAAQTAVRSNPEFYALPASQDKEGYQCCQSSYCPATSDHSLSSSAPRKVLQEKDFCEKQIPGRPRKPLADTYVLSCYKRLGDQDRRLLCGGCASTDRRMI